MQTFFEVALYNKNKVAVRYSDSCFLTLKDHRLRLVRASKVRGRVTYSSHVPLEPEAYYSAQIWLTRCLEDRAVFTTPKEFLEEYVSVLKGGQLYYKHLFDRHL